MFKLYCLFFACALFVCNVCSQESTTSSPGFFSKLNSLAQSAQSNSNSGGGSDILGAFGSIAQALQNRGNTAGASNPPPPPAQLPQSNSGMDFLSSANSFIQSLQNKGNAPSAPSAYPPQSPQSNASPTSGSSILSSANSFFQSLQHSGGSNGGSGILGSIQSYAQSFQNKGSPTGASNLPTQPAYPAQPVYPTQPPYPTQQTNNAGSFGSPNSPPYQSLYPQLPPLPNNDSPVAPPVNQSPQNTTSSGGIAEFIKNQVQTHGKEIVQRISTDPRIQQAISKVKQELDNAPQRAQSLLNEKLSKTN